ncbi:MAG: hypothetical protein CMO01_09640 [Thalassobius sp.]|nr:hypothetical protein [Thalassovita sp.]
MLITCASTQTILAQLSNKSRVQSQSEAYSTKKFIPAVTLNLKSEFPLQHAISIEFATQKFISFYVGMGMFSRAYAVTATNFLPAENTEEEMRQKFIKDKMENGSVLELGSYYHFVKKKDVYVGLNIQFQQFKLSATPQELVEEYDFADSQNLGETLQDLIDNNSTINAFYENTIIEPQVKPIQLGITIGKRFPLTRNRKLALNTEIAYHFNIATYTTLTSTSLAGQILINNIINPILENNTDASFNSFNLPSVSLRLNYQLSNRIFY